MLTMRRVVWGRPILSAGPTVMDGHIRQCTDTHIRQCTDGHIRQCDTSVFVFTTRCG